MPEFKVIPGLIDANPDWEVLGVKAALCDKIATLVPPTYIDETTLLPPELANVSITKTKWKRTDFEYHMINGYSVIKDNLGRVKCSCKGFHFRKNCRHVKELNS